MNDVNYGSPPPRPTMTIRDALREPTQVLGAAAAAMLFMTSQVIPILGMLMGSLAPVPLVYFYHRKGRVFGLTMTALALGAVFLMGLLLDGPWAGLVFLEYAALAVVMGHGLSRAWPVTLLIAATTAAAIILAVALLALPGLGHEDGLSLDMVEKEIRTSVIQYQAWLTGQTPPEATSETTKENAPTEKKEARRPIRKDQSTLRKDETPPLDQELDRLIHMLISIFPGLLAMGTMIVVWANFMVVRVLLGRAGDLPPTMIDLNRWKSPDLLIWVAIACGFGAFLGSGNLRVVAVNGLLVLGLVYFFHGLAIVAFWMEKKNVPTFLRAVIYTIVALQQYLAVLVAILGLFDLWIDFRKLKTPTPNPSGSD